MDKQVEQLYQKKYRDQKLHICIPGVKSWLDEFLVLLFPIMGQQFFESIDELKSAISLNKKQLIEILKCQSTDPSKCTIDLADEIYSELFSLEETLNKDVDFFIESDPASSDANEVISAYPGFYAIACHRIAHKISLRNFPLIARMISAAAHQKAGVDIHPGAKIGSPFFIDHATGIVIGETTVIGNRVSIYQGVTLGALKVNKNMEGVKRHPTVEDDCILYANATILGGETVIGKGSVVGGNVWLSRSVVAGSSVFNDSNIRVR